MLKVLLVVWTLGAQGYGPDVMSEREWFAISDMPTCRLMLETVRKMPKRNGICINIIATEAKPL